MLDIQDEIAWLGAAWLDCPVTKCVLAAGLVAAPHFKVKDKFKQNIYVILDPMGSP